MMLIFILIFFIIKFYTLYALNTSVISDENGYIMYCPCMGRFGNQFEQFLGSLLFAHHLNRTLILPPFIEYGNYEISFTPFDKYFDLDRIKEYHRVITMHEFMEYLSQSVWSQNERLILCYSSRNTGKSGQKGCFPFEGNPFKAFWHHFNITSFADSVFHSPLVTQYFEAKLWKAHYKHIKVLAFVGPPSSYPTNPKAIPLQQHIQFSNRVSQMANEYREIRNFARTPYLAIHLRHGTDWVKACNLLKESSMGQFFSSYQCTESLIAKNEELKLPYELCYHSDHIIVNDIKSAIIDKRNAHKITTIYIATDFNNETLWQHLSEQLPEFTIISPTVTFSPNGKAINQPPASFIIDAYLLSNANYFIGNCISSFSAFSSRYRIFSYHLNRTTKFFGQNTLFVKKHDEL